MNFLYKLNKRSWATLMMLCFMVSIYAQQSFTGVVMDENDLPLIGATVMVKGTNNGTVTDLDGKFTIKVQREGVTLTISYIGYQTQDVKFKKGQYKMTIKMHPDNAMLDEVVVVGYGSMKRSDLTGSVASVSSKTVEGFKSSSVVEALGGQVAGVQITQTEGSPGSGFDIKIRGVGTLTGDASPLYIVDGFEVDNIDYLSNSDIENIQILKDASSSAIYGARAANGVVLVTTKSGKEGKPVISYNGSATYRNITKYLDLLNPYEFVKLQMELDPGKYANTYFKSGLDADGNPYRYQSMDDYIGVDGVDWQDEVYRPTWSQDHNVSIVGGNKSTKYSASFSRYQENGIFNNSGFDKTTGKVRFNQKISKSVSFDATINYVQSNKNGQGTSADNGRFNMLTQILSARPTGGLRMTDDELLHSAIDPLELEESESLGQVNPVTQTESVTNHKKSEMWSGNFALYWQIIKGLTFKTAATYNTTNTRNDIFYRDGSKEAYRNGQMPYGQTQNTKDLRWSNYNQLTWKQKIRKHSYDVMLGHEVSFRSSEYVLGQSMNFPFGNLENDNLGIGALPSRVTSFYHDKTLLSFFVRANYNFNQRYILTATVRADGSTVFSDNHKWGFFPSFSAAWRISEENFMKDVDWISNLKLRFGWGIVGNDRIANYLSLDLYSMSKYGIGNSTTTVLQPKQLPNPDLKWEGSSSTNLGIDWGMFDNRLNITADFFIKDTKDLLLDRDIPYISGFASQKQNIGKIRNKGIELAINTVNFKKRNFTWTTDLNISFIRNELVALQSGVTEMPAYTNFNRNDFTTNDFVARVGESLGLIYGYEFDGVYQSSDFITNPSGDLMLKPGVVENTRYTQGPLAPGVVKYKDQNGDGKITTEDRTVIGNALPKWFGGITNTFAFKGFDFSFMFQYNYGNDIFNATRLNSTQSKKQRSNLMAEVADRWTPSNASNKVPSASGYITGDVYSRFVEDGSFFRLKNVTLGYSFPKKWIKAMRMSKLRIYATGQNLFCLSNYSGYDPEVSTRSYNPMTPGVDWGAYPRSMSFTFGLDVQF